MSRDKTSGCFIDVSRPAIALPDTLKAGRPAFSRFGMVLAQECPATEAVMGSGWSLGGIAVAGTSGCAREGRRVDGAADRRSTIDGYPRRGAAVTALLPANERGA